MIKVGIVGFGFMGRMHYACWSELADAEIVVVCDANPNIIEDTKNAIGNIEGAAEQIDFDSFKLYSDFDEMIAKEKLDVISITLPTYLHPDFTIKSLKAGVNVLCEKPMALNADECQRMAEAAKQTKKYLMIAHCIRFWPEYAETKNIIDSGKYGKVLAATFKRVGSPPNWAADEWFFDESRSGGMALDLHIHDTDYVQYLFGMPKAVCSHAQQTSTGNLTHVVTEYDYDDDTLVTAEAGWLMTPAFGFEMSFNIMLEKATIVYDCTRAPAFRVCTDTGEVITPEVSGSTGYSLQTAHFAKIITGQSTPDVTDLLQSENSVKISLAEIESARKGQKVDL